MKQHIAIEKANKILKAYQLPMNDFFLLSSNKEKYTYIALSDFGDFLLYIYKNKELFEISFEKLLIQEDSQFQFIKKNDIFNIIENKINKDIEIFSSVIMEYYDKVNKKSAYKSMMNNFTYTFKFICSEDFDFENPDFELVCNVNLPDNISSIMNLYISSEQTYPYNRKYVFNYSNFIHKENDDYNKILKAIINTHNISDTENISFSQIGDLTIMELY